MKKTSLMYEPKRLINALGSTAQAVILFTSVMWTWGKKTHAEMGIEENRKYKEAFQHAVIELKTPAGRQGWKNYVLSAAVIQIFLTSILGWNIAILSGIGMAVGFIILVTAIILFGYRAWMIKEQALVPFGYYIKNIMKHPDALLIFKTYNLVEKQWPSSTTS